MIIIYKYTDKEIKQIIKDAIIVVDTREQKNKHITDYFDSKGINWCEEKLDWGDYTIKTNSFSGCREVYLQDICTIERKGSLDELAANLSTKDGERTRFESEFLRARGQVHLLIENASYADMFHGRYRSLYGSDAFINSLMRFQSSYKLAIHFEKDLSVVGDWVYRTLAMALRTELKKGVIG